jgi:hypothetical protein
VLGRGHGSGEARSRGRRETSLSAQSLVWKGACRGRVHVLWRGPHPEDWIREDRRSGEGESTAKEHPSSEKR